MTTAGGCPIIWLSDDRLRCVTWNGSATFNIYQRAATWSSWINVDVWTQYDIHSVADATTAAAEHMTEEQP